MSPFLIINPSSSVFSQSHQSSHLSPSSLACHLDNDSMKTIPQSFVPPTDRETFKDLLVFEERLKQNAARLQRQRVKYEAFLFSMVVVTIVLAYKSLLATSSYQMIHYLYVGLLLVSITTLALFFATGMYTDRILYAYKFIPQTNRALRPFNMFLNTPPSALSWLRSAIGWGVKPTTRAEVQPALVNPRGELLFSSRVSTDFIDRYEAYRTQWERRQKK